MNGEIVLTTLAFLVALALLFDFMNGFHDAANSIATVVSTGVLKPYQAVAWAAMHRMPGQDGISVRPCQAGGLVLQQLARSRTGARVAR